jgi:hypothetical protein
MKPANMKKLLKQNNIFVFISIDQSYCGTFGSDLCQFDLTPIVASLKYIDKVI